MFDQIRSFVRIAADEGIARAVLAAVGYVVPSPYGERLLFTARFVEDGSGATLPWRTRLALYRRGFLPSSYYLYDFGRYGTHAYVSDFDRRWSGTGVNRSSREFLMDKKKFYDLLERRGFGSYLPIGYGTLTDGVLVGTETDFLSLLRDTGALVVKGRTGAGGSKVHVCTFDAGAYVLDGDQVSRSTLRDRLTEFEGYLVTEFCRQADYADAIYPDTANTIRVVTMHPDDGDPFVASAVHRIGTDESGHVDNFSRGGLSAEVRADGRLGPAVRFSDHTVSWHETHPDTGSRIAGTVVPGWEHVRTAVLSVAAAVPEFEYVGWDLVVTETDEFKIIEGNSNTDVDLLQAHRPLLDDPAVRSFYEERGLA